MANSRNWVLDYYQGLRDGGCVASKWVHLLYERIIRDLEAGLYKFDQKKANRAIDWIESHCFHTEGPLAPGSLKLELWQKAFVSCIFGLVDDNGLRHYREFVLIIARKNGKSLLASAIANYVFQAEGGFGCRVYNIAPKLDQSSIIYDSIWTMIQLDPVYRQAIENYDEQRKHHHEKRETKDELPVRRTSDIFIRKTNSTVKKISSDSRKSDGFNPSLCICDEVASWVGEKGLKTYEVWKSGMGARQDGILLSCSTSGYQNDGIYDELIKRSTRFLLGDSKEKRLLPFLYIIDDPEKWSDINELRKSNPNLGVSVPVDYLLDEIAIAEGSFSKRGEFLVKYACIKQNSSQAWLPAISVEKCAGPAIDLAAFKNCYCVGGIDLSMTTDLTACCAVIERDGILNVVAKFFLPAEKLEDAIARDGLPYRAYIDRGLLQLSGDNFVDYDDCFAWFRELIERWQIYPLQVGYDRYSAQQLVKAMEGYGFHMDDVYQGYNLTGVLSEAEGLIKDGRINIGDNDLLKVHLLNAALKSDNEGMRYKLVKLSAMDHIDGCAAFMDALTVRQKWWHEIGAKLQNERH